MIHIPKIRFLRKRTFVKFQFGKVAKMVHTVQIILADTVMTEVFRNEGDRNDFYESISSQLRSADQDLNNKNS